MKAAIPTIVTLLLLLGCASQGTDNAVVGAPESNASTPETQPVQPPVNTSGLSFGRDAGGVMDADTNFTEPERPHFDFSAITNGDGKLIVYYFYSPKCAACKALAPEMERMEAEHSEAEFMRYDLSTKNGSYAYQDFAAQHNLSTQQMLVPQALVNGTILTDRFNINNSLGGIISGFS